MRRMMLGLGLVVALSGTAQAGDLPTSETVSMLAKRLSTQLNDGGIIGVGEDVQKCYDVADADQTMRQVLLRQCVLYDSAAYRFDRSMHNAFEMHGHPINQTPYFTERAFGLRLSYYGHKAFSSDAAAHRYLTRPSAQIAEAVE